MATAGGTLSFQCGIEYEYLIAERLASGWYLHSHQSLVFERMQALLANKPGGADPTLRTGDLGVKQGYWYLEGDERFDEQGQFAGMAVKGVEIRTPPRPGVAAAIDSLLQIEQALAEQLARADMALAVCAFHPYQTHYRYDPPINGFEMALRAAEPAYAAAQVSTLSYGPDINLSFAHFTDDMALSATRRLIWWAPYLVPFSFNSPWFAGHRWDGWSKRTFERRQLRPSAKLFCDAKAGLQPPLYPARLPAERGRIEFKAFDAMPTISLLQACSWLLVGLCLAHDRPEQADEASGDLFQLAATQGFAHPLIRYRAGLALGSAQQALQHWGLAEGLVALRVLDAMLESQQTPAEQAVQQRVITGLPYQLGGLGASIATAPAAPSPFWSCVVGAGHAAARSLA